MSVIKSFLMKSDITISQLFYMQTRRIILDAFMVSITHIGSTIISICMPLVFLFIGLYTQEQAYLEIGLNLAIVLSVSEGIVHILKKCVGRQRPFQCLNHIDVILMEAKSKELMTCSFPSGHTCAAFSIAFVFSYYFPFGSPYFLLVAILVGISRIYLGVHYFMDVVVGALIAYIVFEAYLLYNLFVVF